MFFFLRDFEICGICGNWENCTVTPSTPLASLFTPTPNCLLLPPSPPPLPRALFIFYFFFCSAPNAAFSSFSPSYHPLSPFFFAFHDDDDDDERSEKKARKEGSKGGKKERRKEGKGKMDRVDIL